MSSADEPSTDARAAIDERIEEIRRADFTATRRGYDRDEVQRYLGSLADWLESLGLGDPDRGEVRRELAWVGERTAEILTKAAEEAERMRAEAEEETRAARLEAGTQAEETVAQAERRAEELMEEATRRRHDLQVLIGDLLERRDEIVADGRRLADELGELFADYDEEPGCDEVDEEEELAAEGPDTEEQPSSAR